VIYQLTKKDYEKVRPTFEGMDYHLVVNSIVAGMTPARIYADHPTHPKAAFTWTKHRFYLAGDAGNDAFNRALNRLFVQEIYPQAIAAGMSAFVLYYSPDNWEDQIDVILEDKFPTKHLRQFWAVSELGRDWRRLMPAGFAMRRVDRGLLAEAGLKNRDALIEEMQSERASIEEFLSKSFGFCMLHGEEIIGWCLSEYNSENECEVGIETAEAYRRQGIATLTALALIEHGLVLGMTRIGWHCWANNEGSIATAERVGFKKVTDYPVYYVGLKDAEILA
jgi:RimJ/RimL family protein N-acetyltransferase